ncbi:MAG: hypothetical protein WB780_22370 [Candidatus Acidiferrales bacterium]
MADERKCGRKKHRSPPCGVFIPERNAFCDLYCVSIFRRCQYHSNALKQDSLYARLKKMKRPEQKRALDILDSVQKVRPHWEYQGDEESLIREQEAKKK